MMHSLALLAGGQSSRFGGDKARAMFGTRWPLREMVERLRPAAAEVLVIGGDPALANALQASPVADRLHEAGPLAGIEAALAAAAREFVLILPCDMPRLPYETAELFSSRIGDQDALLLRRAGIAVPVCGLYRRALAPALAAALAAGMRRINGALAAQRVGYLDAEALPAPCDPDDFSGFNTREEFARLFPSKG